MPGPWQHHIPGLLQRGFGIRTKSGRPKEIWVFTRDAAPEIQLITDTNADINFYSEPSTDEWTTLDGRITKYETPLADHVAAARAATPGQQFDADVAAEIVTHLAFRTQHVRELLQQGLQDIGQGIAGEFATSTATEHLLGLDSLAPSDVFKDSLLSEIRRTGLAHVPESLALQIAFQLARENFDQFSPAVANHIAVLGGKLIENAGALIREAHNKALNQAMDKPGHAWVYLRSFVWTIETAAKQVILPDCVALGIDRDRTARPLLLADRETLLAVVMPLSSRILLVGLKDATQPIDISDFNIHAAACSHRHYQASANTPEIAQLGSLIGTRSSAVVESEVRQTLQEHFPHSRLAAAAGDSDRERRSATEAGEPTNTDPPPLQYEISFAGCADQENAERIAAIVKHYITKLSAVMPLARLDGITFAGDYATAVRAIDRGVPGIPPIEPTSADGAGVARTIAVLRDGVVRGRVVMDAGIGYALLGDEASTGVWADYVVVYELALVSMIEVVDKTLPNNLLRPIGNHHEGWLFACVNSALDSYVAADFSANFGNADEIAEHYRDRLVATLDRADTEVPKARRAYRQHADLEHLLKIAIPATRAILACAADFLGHCDALGRPPIAPTGPLASALERHGLTRWLPVFQADLRKLRQRLGQWESFDEFLRFNRHVERVLWHFGIFPWQTPEGVSRVEVPLTTDAAALLSLVQEQAPPPDRAG